MTTCIEVWTPTRILDCVEDDNGNAVDPFVQAVPDSNYKTLQVQALWRRYRYAVCDSLNVERWLQQIKDRAEEVNRRYIQMFAAYDANDLSDMKMGYTDTVDETVAATGKVGQNVTASSTGTGTNKTETEDLPQSEVADGKYLSGRTTVNTTTGTDDTSTATTDTEDSSTRHSTMKHDTQDVLLAEEYAQLMDVLRDPLEKYVWEFSDLFANRW